MIGKRQQIENLSRNIMNRKKRENEKINKNIKIINIYIHVYII